MSRLWEKGQPLDREMFDLTVGNDPESDLEIAAFDALGTAAHVTMLSEIGLIASADLGPIKAELKTIYEAASNRNFSISRELEDCHTAIETQLVDKLGEAGRRVHAARSRNDQVLLAVRLYLRNFICLALESQLDAVRELFKKASEYGSQQLPGYTHFQSAMPSSVGMWLHSWIEGLLSYVREGLFWSKEVNANPLGSAAGFGVPLPIKRERVAALLSFDRIQRSFIDVNNSRGRFEERILHWAAGAASVYEKFACDFMLFSTAEFGFFSLPLELTTGSSIMPQKRNPDLVELLRARPSKVRAASEELFGITHKLPSSYHRDLQYTKEPLFRGCNEFLACSRMFILVVSNLKTNPEKMRAAMTDDLFATYDAYREVSAGKPFRDAYRNVAEKLKTNSLDRKSLEGDFAPIAENVEAGLKEAKSEFDLLERQTKSLRGKLEGVPTALFSANNG
jgi:argininosuccinate lyase